MNNMYIKLLIMAVLSFISMYILMYMMVDRFENVYPNINQFYMAGMMTAPMILFEIVLMSSMYKNKTLNLAIAAVSVAALVLFIVFTRQQTAVGDEQFLKSMIPHHAGAILMCDNPRITDAKIRELCREITASQVSEIDQMKQLLAEIENR